ncbi:MAG TPA: hypothetical protein ENN13_05500 [Candidatus Altiarchaeales archaeon]|nr:hypothetical protein [Candidatus Altiarchaeales archaeon]
MKPLEIMSLLLVFLILGVFALTVVWSMMPSSAPTTTSSTTTIPQTTTSTTSSATTSIPVPTTLICVDGDGGLNELAQSTVIWREEGTLRQEWDSCINDNSVLEWYCAFEDGSYTGKNATLFCPVNHVCRDGACVMAETSTTTTTSTSTTTTAGESTTSTTVRKVSCASVSNPNPSNCRNQGECPNGMECLYRPSGGGCCGLPPACYCG